MIVNFGDHVLELLQEKHAWRICNFMVSNEDRFKTYFPVTLAQNLTPELSQLFVKQKLKSFQKKEEFVFVLKNIKERTIDGIFYIKDINWEIKQGELAYAIGYEIERKGFTTKVVQVLSDYAFKELHLTKLQIITHKTNIGSVKVAEKCNFTWIRTLEKSFTPIGLEPLDMELYELQNER
ncbi:GNAT family N-acetyltransferase [Polaribacter septentrionalilitoris]|uniref:GNAT family N-acetyltransferase n=1 Tax=Polaribacter septentrionalilitoris TaxID=2494657 RepID=UPI00135CA2BD|nr:GNAT family N-acetyltransferase [Polaribacter septentrionalilitoris]